jgi:hypothetical protein
MIRIGQQIDGGSVWPFLLSPTMLRLNEKLFCLATSWLPENRWLLMLPTGVPSDFLGIFCVWHTAVSR